MEESTATNGPYTIVICGACNSGKTSLINAITGTKRSVSEDGTPMTVEVEPVAFGNKIYIDTPGLQKSSSRNLQIPSSTQYLPSIIWLLLNFQAAIEDEEFSILDANPDIPVIVILNKADMLTNEAEVENFHKSDYSSKNRKLAVLHQRLIEKKKSNSNLRHILAMSLKDDDNDQRSPIGIDFLQKMTDLELENSETNLIQQKPVSTESEGSDVIIAVIGYNSSGKSSLVNAILQGSKAATVGMDNSLTTGQWTCYGKSQVQLWDGPAVNKRALEQQQHIIPIASEMKPDIIWWVVNYQSSDIEDELDLRSILRIEPNVPVVIIINKVDFLRKISDLSEEDLVQLSREAPATRKFSTRKKLRDMIDSINNKWQNLVNVKAITVTSLFDDNVDDEKFKIIGVNALLNITREHLESDSKRHAFDILKQANEEYRIVPFSRSKGSPLKEYIQKFIAYLRDWFHDMISNATSG